MSKLANKRPSRVVTNDVRLTNRVAARWAGAQKILEFLSRGTRVIAPDPSHNPVALHRLTGMYNL
ncbi:hypothetical protein NVP1244A_198 [Vibrio phage 1.244.A._10N.261.54.C3]|nr:hypothetical protein NVP1244A_198 [Vibrio phage 1.244.A._10N.261.54.C3]AUR98826.1 hypothetical protein NVP1255O_198 [Vibrio phage 1.255.O._10N.286.45.F1]